MTDTETDIAETLDEGVDLAAEEQQHEADAEHGGDQQQAEQPKEVFVFDGDDAGAEQVEDSSTIREIRAKLREEQREKHELRKRLDELSAPKADALPDKPTLESCGYDEDQFEQNLTAWHAKKAELDARQSEQQAKQQQAQQAWATRVTSFEERAKALVPDYAEQAGILAEKFGNDLNGNAAKAALIFADDPRLIAALNNSPTKLAELLALKDNPLELAVALGELKGKLRTMPRKSPPPPETITRGGAPVAASTDKQLERLEKEADRTGDRTAVVAYKRMMKQREKAA